MIAVIVLPPASETMLGLDASRPAPLLPLGDRPALQHMVEYLLANGVSSIDFIADHAPEPLERLLGNGERWGSSFRYHLAGSSDQPYRSLRVIPGLAQHPWWLVHAERFPCFTPPAVPPIGPLLFMGEFLDGNASAPEAESESSPEAPSDRVAYWGGTALLPPGSLADQLAPLTRGELCDHLEHLVREDAATSVKADRWIDVASPRALLHSQHQLLCRELPGLLMSGTERQPGIWTSRNVVVHPSATLTAPLFVGPNSLINRDVALGPNTVVSSNCIVDTETAIQDSLLLPGTYVGENLELNRVIVDRNLLVNVRMHTRVDRLESFFISALEQPGGHLWLSRALHSGAALLLLLLLWPVLLLAALVGTLTRRHPYTSVEVVRLPTGPGRSRRSAAFSLGCLGVNSWTHPRAASWATFLRQFLPGLPAVLRGDLRLVGLPPRTPSQVNGLSHEWRTLYGSGTAGLITEASVSGADPEDELQQYVADAYYVAKRSWWHDLGLAGRYAGRLFRPSSHA